MSTFWKFLFVMMWVITAIIIQIYGLEKTDGIGWFIFYVAAIFGHILAAYYIIRDILSVSED